MIDLHGISPHPPLRSTVTAEEVVEALNSDAWRIEGPKAYLRRLYKLAKNAKVPERPLIKKVWLDSGSLFVRTNRREVSFDISSIKLDRFDSGLDSDMIIIGMLVRVMHDRKRSEGGGKHPAIQLGTQIVLKKV